MNVEEHARRYPEVWRRFSPRETLLRYAWYLGIVFVVVWSLRNLDIPWLYFLDAHEQAADLLVRMFPPDWAFFDKMLNPLIEAAIAERAAAHGFAVEAKTVEVRGLCPACRRGGAVDADCKFVPRI